MAVIYEDGSTVYTGAVYAVEGYWWADGMLEDTAYCWDVENHNTKALKVGYYGSDCNNLCRCDYSVDISTEAARDMVRTYKRTFALEAFAKSVAEAKTTVKAGSNVVVVKGRKVKKGTALTVFWVGEKETYLSKQYSWMHETEEIAGCKDVDGNKYWIKTEYLKVTDPIKSPDRKNRELFIASWLEQHIPMNVMKAARG